MYDCQQRIPFLDTNSLPRRNLGVIGRLWVHKDPVGQFIVDLRQSARRRLHRYDQVLGKISIEIAGDEVGSASFIDQHRSLEYTSDFGVAAAEAFALASPFGKGMVPLAEEAPPL